MYQEGDTLVHELGQPLRNTRATALRCCGATLLIATRSNLGINSLFQLMGQCVANARGYHAPKWHERFVLSDIDICKLQYAL